MKLAEESGEAKEPHESYGEIYSTDCETQNERRGVLLCRNASLRVGNGYRDDREKFRNGGKRGENWQLPNGSRVKIADSPASRCTRGVFRGILSPALQAAAFIAE